MAILLESSGGLRSRYTKEEIEMEKSEKSNDIIIESLRLNLEKVRKDKAVLEDKEIEIKKQIDKLTQGE